MEHVREAILATIPLIVNIHSSQMERYYNVFYMNYVLVGIARDNPVLANICKKHF